MRRKGAEGQTKYRSDGLCTLPRRRVRVPSNSKPTTRNTSRTIINLSFLPTEPKDPSRLPRNSEMKIGMPRQKKKITIADYSKRFAVRRARSTHVLREYLRLRSKDLISCAARELLVYVHCGLCLF
jgi:hypothetical protein